MEVSEGATILLQMTRADDIGLEWHRKVRCRRGGRTRLDGLEIFYDFNWLEVFGNGRSQFHTGSDSQSSSAKTARPERSPRCS